MERAGETRGKDKMTFLICMVATTFVSGVEMKLLRTSCKSEAEFSIILEGIYDSGSPLKKLSTPTRQKCLLHCQATLGCSSVNYKKVGGDCDLFSRNMTASKGLLQVKTGWEYISTNDYDQNLGNECKKRKPCQNGGSCEDTCDEAKFRCICNFGFTGKYCQEEPDFSSCQAAYNAGHRKDGVYLISKAGYHYCVLSNSIDCGGGGYTLVMRTDGNLPTFRFESTHWTTNSVYNYVYALREGLHGQEAKFQGFNTLPVTTICIGMRAGASMKFLQIHQSATSLLDLFSSNTYHGSHKGRNAWLGLVPSGTMQSKCNKEGFNIKIDSPWDSYVISSYVRIGIIGNEQDDCISVDTGFGIGIGGAALATNHIYTGATENKIAAKGYIFIK